MCHWILPFQLLVCTLTPTTACRHVTAIVRSCFATLRQIRMFVIFLHYVWLHVCALVISKVHYPQCWLLVMVVQLMQLVLNSTAWLIFPVRNSEHITLCLSGLHGCRSSSRSGPTSISWHTGTTLLYVPCSDHRTSALSLNIDTCFCYKSCYFQLQHFYVF